jgi:CDP-diacylglycerol--serine O-phosphatidyltransferase
MANAITRHIPNTVTCLNLFSGCIASVMAFEAQYEWALVFIIFSAIFDFFDGMLARVLKAPSLIGKELDSLADDISFGLVPLSCCFHYLKKCHTPTFCQAFPFLCPTSLFL